MLNYQRGGTSICENDSKSHFFVWNILLNPLPDNAQFRHTKDI